VGAHGRHCGCGWGLMAVAVGMGGGSGAVLVVAGRPVHSSDTDKRDKKIGTHVGIEEQGVGCVH
jgi:hypothetical protein